MLDIRFLPKLWRHAVVPALQRIDTSGFAHTPTANVVLLDRQLLHPLDRWYHVAMVYDGAEFRSYVNGVLQGKASIHLEPQGRGHSSIGVRINQVNYIKGSVRQARFSRRALATTEFLKLPDRIVADQSGKIN